MIQTLPVIDIAALPDGRLHAAVKIFDALDSKALFPVHQLHEDPVRRELDEQYGRDVLGLSAAMFADGGPMDVLRQKLAAEPSVRGDKSDKPA